MPRRRRRLVIPRLGNAPDTLETRLEGLRGADRVATFLRVFCKHVKGWKAGLPFELADWQMDEIIRPLYDTLRPDRLRRYRQGYLSFARKSGKSTLAAGLSLYHLFADAEYGAEVYCAASSREQASLIFDIAASMVEMSPALRARAAVTRHQKTIRDKQTNSILKALSALVPHLHGLSTSFAVIDEIAQQPNRDLYDVLTSSVGARRQPLILSIGTAGWDEHSIAFELYKHAQQVLSGAVQDPAFFALVKELPADGDWTDEALWPMANPGLDDFRDREELRQTCERAKLVPSQQNTFRNLYCNQWVKTETRWLSLVDWDACPPVDVDLIGRTCYAGLDLSSTRDVTALVLAFPLDDGTVALLPRFWLPGDGLKDRCRRDRVPYDQWEKQGVIELTAGNYVDFSAVEQGLREARDKYDLRCVAYDPWSAKQLAQRMQGEGIPVAEFPQTISHFAEPTRAFEKRVLARTFRHGGNPMLRWMLDCTSVKVDANGNPRPVKPDRMKDSRRIDGIVAGIMALSTISAAPDLTGFLEDPLIIDVNGPAEKRAAIARNQ